MDEDYLMKQSKVFKKEADLLLKQAKLLELLRSYGRIRLTGSYRLGLMLNGDIDIHVVNPKIKKELVVELLRKLINKGFFNGYLFYDWIKFRKAEFPRGYYIGLKKKFNQKKWKVDIWFLSKDDHRETKLVNLVEKCLNEETKLAILRLKHARNVRKLEIPSHQIYLAVIKRGITDFKELLRASKWVNLLGKR